MKTRKVEICEDLILEILYRLPGKTLCKLKCVSKQWCNLISDPSFLNLHRDLCQKNPRLLILRHISDYRIKDKQQYPINLSSMQLSNPRLPILRHISDYRIKDKQQYPINLSSMQLDKELNHENNKGELSLQSTEFEAFVDGCGEFLPSKAKNEVVCFATTTQLFVLNPSTQEFICLPEVSRPKFSVENSSGFAYLSSTNEYMFVHMFDQSLNELITDYRCEILTMSHGCNNSSNTSRSWRIIEERCPHKIGGFAVMANNAFHWMVFPEIPPLPGPIVQVEFIVSLDIETEKFSIIRRPQGCSNSVFADLYVVELKGLLCLVDNFATPSTMELWMLKDYKNQVWVKEYSIYVPGLDGELHFIEPLYDLEEEILIHKGREGFYCYNILNKSTRRVLENLNLKSTEVCMYTASLFSLGSQ